MMTGDERIFISGGMRGGKTAVMQDLIDRINRINQGRIDDMFDGLYAMPRYNQGIKEAEVLDVRDGDDVPKLTTEQT